MADMRTDAYFFPDSIQEYRRIFQFPGVFESVQDVYRTKQNVLERLRRNQALCKLLAAYA